MDTMEKTPMTRPGARPPKRGGWLIAAAAFAVVIVVGFVAFFGGSDSSPTTVAPVASSATEAPTTTATTTEAPTTTATEAPPATEAPTTTEAVDLIAESEALMTAIYGNDLAGIEGLVSPRANTDFMVYFAGFVEVLNADFGGEVFGWTCSETAAGNVVRCEVDYVDDMVVAVGLEQATETWDIGFAFDGVQSATFSPQQPDPLEPALRAMFETHPEWFDVGGPCEGAWEEGDPTTCAPAWAGFVIEWFTDNG